MIQELDPVGRELSTTVAEMSVNNFKNRHSNILPYDRTRIKLTKVNDREGSDYINGNWMPVCTLLINSKVAYTFIFIETFHINCFLS